MDIKNDENVPAEASTKPKATWKDSPVKEVAKDTLPALQRTFWVEYYSALLRKTMIGAFTFKKLTVAQVAQVGVRRAVLNGDRQVDAVTNMVNNWLAHFDLCIVKSPEWWKPHDEYDDELMEEIFKKVVSFENSFRDALERSEELV